MKKLFVPYELALLAKEKGFNESCLASYEDIYNKEISFRTILQNNSDFKPEYGELCKYQCSAPLYQQLVDWFREKHSLSIEVSEWSKNFSGKVKPIGKSLRIQTANKLYYEALSEALTEAFKLI